MCDPCVSRQPRTLHVSRSPADLTSLPHFLTYWVGSIPHTLSLDLQLKGAKPAKVLPSNMGRSHSPQGPRWGLETMPGVNPQAGYPNKFLQGTYMTVGGSGPRTKLGCHDTQAYSATHQEYLAPTCPKCKANCLVHTSSFCTH